MSECSTSKKLREKYKLKTTLVDLLLWKYIWQSKFINALLVTKSSEGDKTKTYFLKTTPTTWLAVFFFQLKMCGLCSCCHWCRRRSMTWWPNLLGFSCQSYLYLCVRIILYFALVEALQKVAFMCFLFKCKNSNRPWPSYACCIMECDVSILYLNIYRSVLCGWWFLSGVCQIQMMCSIFICTFYLYFVECVWHIFVWTRGCEMFVFVCCTAFDHLYLYISCTFLVHVPKCI